MTRVRAVARWVGRHPTVVAVVVSGAFAAGGFNALQDVMADGQAQRCIDDWELTDAMRRVAPASNEALIEAFPNADPERVAAVKEATVRVVDHIVDDPGCDLEAARRRLDR